MGLLDKVKFWKSEEPLDLDSGLPPLDSGADPLGSSPGLGDSSLGLGSTSGSDPFDLGQQPNWDIEKNLEPMGGGSPRQFGQQPMAQPSQDSGMQRDLELISSKLDAIKASLDSMDQRLRKVETIAENSGKEKPSVTKDPWANY